MQDPDDELPVTALAIGGSMRCASKKRDLTLLLLNSSGKLVFLDHKFWRPAVDGHRRRLQHMLRQMPFTAASLFHHSKGEGSGYPGHRRRLQRMWRQMPFAAASPFHHSRGEDSGYVLAFEVELQGICGMDYSNPLILDGRMVLEAKHVVKREFLTMKDAKEFYRPAGITMGAWLSQQGHQPWPTAPFRGSPPGLTLSSTASTPMMSPEPHASMKPTEAPSGISRRGLSQHFSDPGAPSTERPASMQAASEERRGMPPQQISATVSMTAGASAAGLGRLHGKNMSLPAHNSSAGQQMTASAIHSMPGALGREGLRTSGELGRHQGKRQKTSDSEDEPASSSAGAAYSVARLAGPHGKSALRGSSQPSTDCDRQQLSPASVGPSESNLSGTASPPNVQGGPGVWDPGQEDLAGAAARRLQAKHTQHTQQSSNFRRAAAGGPVSPQQSSALPRHATNSALLSPEDMPRSLGEAQHATAAASKRSVSEPRQRPVKLTPVPEMCPAREANSHSRTPPGQALDQLGSSSASLARQEPKRRSLPADLSRPPPVTTRHQVTGMKHSRSASFEANGYADPQSSAMLGDSLSWPSPSSWTVPSRAYKYRTVSFNFSDPRMPGILRRPIQSNERLLKLYESGLPAWAIYMPLYRLPYRPWMRTVTYTFFVLISIFSLVLGYYDIIKNVPLFRKALSSIVSSLSLPSAAILEWLDNHLTVRMSILFAYMFGKSQLFAQLLTWLAQTWAPIRAALDPLFVLLGPPLTATARLLRTAGGALSLVVKTWGALLSTAVGGLIGPPIQAVLSAARTVRELLLPIWKVAKLSITGPAAAVVTAMRYLASCLQAFWALIIAGARLAPSMQQSAMEAGSQASWWYVMPADALELVRVSSLKTVKALQTVAKFFAQVCNDIARHRLTLRLQFVRHWDACERRLLPYIPAPLLRCATAWQAMRQGSASPPPPEGAGDLSKDAPSDAHAEALQSHVIGAVDLDHHHEPAHVLHDPSECHMCMHLHDEEGEEGVGLHAYLQPSQQEDGAVESCKSELTVHDGKGASSEELAGPDMRLPGEETELWGHAKTE